MEISRRSVATGLAWAVPAVAASTAAPAMAASSCAGYTAGKPLPASAFTLTYLRITNETLGRLSNKQVALDFDFRLSDEAAACGVRTGSVSSTSNGGTSRIALNNGKTYNATNGLAVPANGSVGRTDGTCRLGLDRTEACGTTGQSPYSVAGSTGASSTAVTAISLYRSITVSGYGTTVVYLNTTGVGTNLSVSAAPLI
ncbi:hypothetical protein ACUW6W_002336 [Micrococcus sp. 093350064-1]